MRKVKYIIKWILVLVPALLMIVSAGVAIAVVGLTVAALRFFYMLVALCVNVLVFFLSPLFRREEELGYVSLDATFRDYSRLMSSFAKRITFPEDV